jgi:hypothetical protein
MEQRTEGRRLSDCRTLTEAMNRARFDSGKSIATLAEACGVKRGYLADALNEEREGVMQFQARHFVTYCREVGELPLAWVADQLGFVLVPREQATGAHNLAMETLDVSERAGALAARVRCAMSDGTVDQYEAADIREEARRVQREAAEVERAVANVPVRIGRGA